MLFLASGGEIVEGKGTIVMSENHTNQIEHCLRLISALPQASLIDPETALRWVKRTLKVDGDRIDWHIARAGGIGGSEAGAMLAWAHGGMNVRETVDRLALRKLLVIPPNAANFDTARGNFLEPHIRSVYEGRLTREGRKWRRLEAEKAIVEAGSHPEMPWMRASLDGLYEIDGAVIIPDFKAPSEAFLDAYMRHADYHDYRAQLNHYAVVAEGRGIHIDGLHLVFYDYRRVAMEGVRICDVALNPTLQDKLVHAEDVFWNDYVMQGITPEIDHERVLTASDIPKEIEEQAKLAVNAKMLADHISDVYEDSRKTVARWVSTTGKLGSDVLPVGSFSEGARGFLEMRGASVLEMDAAIERLRELGVEEGDLDKLRLPPKENTAAVVQAYDKAMAAIQLILDTTEAGAPVPKKTLTSLAKMVEKAPAKDVPSGYDPDKVILALEAHGEVPQHFFVENVAGTLPRGKAQDIIERKEMMAIEADNLLNLLVTCKPEEEKSHEEECVLSLRVA